MSDGYKMTKVGELPDSWDAKRLQDVSWFQEGPGLRKWQFTDSGIKVINITNMVNGKLDLTKTDRHISWEEFNKTYKHFACDINDIVIASSGNSYCKHAIVREEDLPLVMNTSVIRFKPLGLTNYEFLNQFLKSELFKNQIDFLITGGAQPNFGPAHLNQIYIPFPSPEEQQKIAEILSTVDEKIEVIDNQITQTQELKKGLMQKLLTRGIGHTQFKNSPLGEIPENWKVGTMEAIAEIIMGQSPSGDTYNQEGNGTPILNGPTEFTSTHPIPVQYTTKPTKFSKEGDILFCVRGSSTGRMNISDQEYCIGRGLAAIRSKANSDTRFIHFLLLHFAEDILRKARDMGSTFPNVSSDELKKRPIVLPPLTEQQKIADILSTVDQKLEMLQEKKSKNHELKKGLMQQLLTGKIRVNQTNYTHDTTKQRHIHSAVEC